MANPDMKQIAKEIDKCKSEILYENNLSVPDKKLMHAWFKYFDQQLKGTETLRVKRDLYNAFKIMSEVGALMPPFNVGPHDPGQKVIKGASQLSEFSRRFEADDFKSTIEGYVERQKTKKDPKKHVKTIVTNKKVVEEDRDPITGVPARVTTVSTTLEVNSNEATTGTVKTRVDPGAAMKLKKERVTVVKNLEEQIVRLSKALSPDKQNTVIDWLKTLTDKLKSAAQIEDRIKALTALKISLTNRELLPPFDEIPARGKLNVREFLSKIDLTNGVEISKDPKPVSREKFIPLDPEIKKQKIQNIKLIEKDIEQQLTEQVPEAVQIFKQWIGILSNKLNREADYDNRLMALMALRKCALHNIIAAPFDVLPKGGVINIRQFLEELQTVPVEERIASAVKGVENVESVIPDELLATGGVSMAKIDGKIPSWINQRMQMIPLRQEIYDTIKSCEYACEYIDKSVSGAYKKWSELFEKAMSSGFKELRERLEFEKECDTCLSKGMLPDFMYDEEVPDPRKFNLPKARTYLRKLKEFNGSDLTEFPEIRDIQSMTQQERKQMLLDRRAKYKEKKTGTVPKIPKDVLIDESIVTPIRKSSAPELTNPLVKNDVLQTVTKNMAKAIDAIAYENLDKLMEIPPVLEQVTDAIVKSPHRQKLTRMKTYDDIITYRRHFQPPPVTQRVTEDLIPFTLEDVPLEEETVSRVIQGDYAPLSNIIIDNDEDLMQETSPDLNTSFYDDDAETYETPRPAPQRKLNFDMTPETTPLIEVEAPSFTAREYPSEYDAIPDEIKAYLLRMVKKELVHWPIFLQDFGSQLKWMKQGQKTGELIYFTP